MGFESRAISARVTKQIVTIFSKTCDKSGSLCNLLLIMVSVPSSPFVQLLHFGRLSDLLLRKGSSPGLLYVLFVIVRS